MIPIYQWRRLLGAQIAGWRCTNVGWGSSPDQATFLFECARGVPCRFIFDMWLLRSYTLKSLKERMRPVLRSLSTSTFEPEDVTEFRYIMRIPG